MLQQLGNTVNPPRCECHSCTQIRYQNSLQGQLAGAIQQQVDAQKACAGTAIGKTY